jgi:hypothetical protein
MKELKKSRDKQWLEELLMHREEPMVGDCLGYPCIDLDLDDAEKILNIITDRLGYVTSDIQDTLRIIENFDESYRYAVKKFKEYLVPVKSESDLIKGRVVIDRVKLTRIGNKKRILIIFDRRVKKELLEEALLILKEQKR